MRVWASLVSVVAERIGASIGQPVGVPGGCLVGVDQLDQAGAAGDQRMYTFSKSVMRLKVAAALTVAT